MAVLNIAMALIVLVFVQENPIAPIHMHVNNKLYQYFL